MYKVLIFQHRLLHYRVELFELLRSRCLEKSIELHLVHGNPTSREKIRNDVGTLPWANLVDNWSHDFFHQDLIWLPFPKQLRDVDLIVIMQENRQLSNYPLLLSRLWSKRRLAYWGHGANLQSDAPTGLLEQWKKLFIKKVDWWFAYTQMTVDILIKSGYPTDQITCLNNAIDTKGFKADLAQVSDAALASERNKLGIAVNAPVGIFCGSLYPDKKLDFLIAAIDIIYQQSPQFHCLVLGDGPSMPYMQVAAASRPWLHLLGVTKGTQKALYFRMADFMLNPGLVGLHIVDAFCAGLVMATTSGAKHSPEIAYLQAGVNGIMTGDNVDDYAQAILSLIADRSLFDNYKIAALASADIYTLDNMVDQFVDGLSRCLAR
jgi:glycosyltransferase involved in cell wall biosynthesis